MSSEIKIYITSLASFIAGLLISFHVGDPSAQNTIAGDINSLFGGLLDAGSAFYALETLLVKHKAEVADNYYTEPEEPNEPEQPNTPTTPIQTVASVSSPSAATPSV